MVGKIPAPQFDPSYGIGIAGRTPPYMGVHHVAFAPELGRGFTADGRARTSTIFDLKTLERIGEVKLTGRDPNAVVYDALIDNNIVQRIDSRNLTLMERWPAGCGGSNNETMAIDKKNGRLFVGCRPDARRLLFAPGPRPDRIMAVLDTNDGHVIATVPIGANPDQAAFDPDAGLVFSANGEGSVTVIKQESPDMYSVLETVATEPGAARRALDAKTHKIFVPNNDTYSSGRGRTFWVLGM